MDYVTFEIAKKLKEKGFDFLCMAYYDKWERLNMSEDFFAFNSKSTGISAPVISQVLKWLREEKRVYVMIDRSFAMNNSWHYSICVNDDFESIIQQESIANKSWEQSALDSIEYILDNLI